MAVNPPENEYEAALNAWLSPGKRPEAAAAPERDPFGGKNAGLADAIASLRELVRKRFSLPAEAAIMVSEVECRLPGCPPLETVIAFWTGDEGEKRHHFKLFKEVKAVGYDDLPFAWLKETLIVPEGFECECC